MSHSISEASGYRNLIYYSGSLMAIATLGMAVHFMRVDSEDKLDQVHHHCGTQVDSKSA